MKVLTALAVFDRTITESYTLAMDGVPAVVMNYYVILMVYVYI